MEVKVSTQEGSTILVNVAGNYFFDVQGRPVTFENPHWIGVAGRMTLAINSSVGQVVIGELDSAILAQALHLPPPDIHAEQIALSRLQNAFVGVFNQEDPIARDKAKSEAVHIALEHPKAFVHLQAELFSRSRIAGKAAAGRAALEMLTKGESIIAVKELLMRWEKHLPSLHRIGVDWRTPARPGKRKQTLPHKQATNNSQNKLSAILQSGFFKTTVSA